MSRKLGKGETNAGTSNGENKKNSKQHLRGLLLMECPIACLIPKTSLKCILSFNSYTSTSPGHAWPGSLNPYGRVVGIYLVTDKYTSILHSLQYIDRSLSVIMKLYISIKYEKPLLGHVCFGNTLSNRFSTLY